MESLYRKACIKLPRDRFFKKETLELQTVFTKHPARLHAEIKVFILKIQFLEIAQKCEA